MKSFDLVAHLKRQIAFSRGTFGPGPRTKGLIDHIRKELKELEDAGGSADEWVDLVILALDGMTREIMANGYDTEDAAEITCRMIAKKQTLNEARDWPDWRTQSQDRAIEHIREGAV